MASITALWLVPNYTAWRQTDTDVFEQIGHYMTTVDWLSVKPQSSNVSMKPC